MSKQKQSVSGTKTAARVLLAAVFVLLAAVCVFAGAGAADDTVVTTGHVHDASKHVGIEGEWYPASSFNELKNIDKKIPLNSTGNYYLTNDIQIPYNSFLTIPEQRTINLCLNGFVIKGCEDTDLSNFPVISLAAGATLNLYDCDMTTTHLFRENTNLFRENTNGLWVLNGSEGEEHIVTGGCITGGMGGGVLIGASQLGFSTLNMYGGNIVGNTGVDGGGVVTSGVFNMYGGNIAGNYASNEGGGVYVAKEGVTGTFTMTGGSIVGNTAPNGGGVMNKYSFTITGGTITDNTASTSGGGVYCLDSAQQFYISGSPFIYGNTGPSSAVNNVYLGKTDILTLINPLTGGEIHITAIKDVSSLTAASFGKVGPGLSEELGAKHFIADVEGDTSYVGTVSSVSLVWTQSPEQFTVTFNNNGHGTEPIPSQNINVNGTVTKPTDLTAEGYSFGGWYREEKCTTKWDFATDTVRTTMTLYAKWTLTPPGLSTSSSTFTYGDDTTATLTASTSVSGVSYKWFETTPGNVKLISEASGNTYTLPPKTSSGEHKYAVEITDDTLTNSSEVTITVNQKEVGLEWTNLSLTYNGMSQAPTATATNLESGDTCKVTVSGAQKDANTTDTPYTATATALGNANYKLPAAATTQFTIGKKSATITPTAGTKVYGAADPALTGTVTGLVSAGDLGTIAYTRDAGENVGEYEMNATYTGNSNYTVTVTSGVKFTITAKALSGCTITDIPDQSRTGSLIDITNSIEVKDGEKTLVKGTDYTVTSGYSGAVVGPYTLTLAGEGNYSGTATTTWNIVYPTHTITTSVPAGHGTISVPETAAEQSEVTVTVTPATGYGLNSLKWTPEGGNATDITTDKKFTMPAANVTVEAEFIVNTYTVTIAVDGTNNYGTVDSESVASVPYNTAIGVSGKTLTINSTTVTATPTPDDEDYTYAFDHWSIENGAKVTSDMTVTAYFKRTPKTPAPKHSSSSSYSGTSTWATTVPTITPATETPGPTPGAVDTPSAQQPAGEQTGSASTPAPILGILAGLGAAAVLFAARQRR